MNRDTLGLRGVHLHIVVPYYANTICTVSFYVQGNDIPSAR